MSRMSDVSIVVCNGSEPVHSTVNRRPPYPLSNYNYETPRNGIDYSLSLVTNIDIKEEKPVDLSI